MPFTPGGKSGWIVADFETDVVPSPPVGVRRMSKNGYLSNRTGFVVECFLRYYRGAHYTETRFSLADGDDEPFGDITLEPGDRFAAIVTADTASPLRFGVSWGDHS